MRFTNRLLLVFFMIALLPFRALAGDVMDTQMAAGQAQSAQLAQSTSDHATNNVAARAHIDLASGTFDVEKTAFEVNQSVHVAKAANAAPVGTVVMAAMPDCPGHAQSGAVAQSNHTPGSTNGNADGNADSCSACQACHSVAIASPSGAFLSTSSTPAQPLAVAIDFTSASLALGQKPPIS